MYPPKMFNLFNQTKSRLKTVILFALYHITLCAPTFPKKQISINKYYQAFDVAKNNFFTRFLMIKQAVLLKLSYKKAAKDLCF